MQDPTLDLSVVNAMGMDAAGAAQLGMMMNGAHVVNTSQIISGANLKDVVSVYACKLKWLWHCTHEKRQMCC